MRVLWVLVMSFMSTHSFAQVLVASDPDAPQSHAWAVYRNVNDEIILVHVPPRDQTNDDRYSISSADLGEVQAVRPLNKFPQGLAAIDDQVFMVFPQTYATDRIFRRVYSGRVGPNPMGDRWGFTPIDRLNSLPSIEGEGELVEFAATNQNLWAMLEGEGGQFTLFLLEESEWVEIPFPKVRDADRAEWKVVGDNERLIALDLSDRSEINAHVWSKDQAWRSLDWPSVELLGAPFEIHSNKHGVLIIDSVEGDGTRIRSWSKDGVFVLATGLKISPDTKITVLGSVNRLLGITKNLVDPSDREENSPTIIIDEVDLADGTVLYSGTPFVEAPVSAGEMRFILGMMILIMIGIVVLVILPEKSSAISVPDGFELADPGRRFTASLIDLFLIASLLGRVFGVRVIEILTLDVVSQSENSWLVIPVVILTAMISMTLFEWGLGVTPGKFLVGIRVVRGQSGKSKRISLMSALVRNITKWLLPPVAALALVDPEMLHRGDRVTRTLVVSPVPPDGTASDSSED
tara:strand:+ start:44854 stop:46410 length:1557 start_codon:yes stop_codon:yes gene_type:complete